MKDRTLVFYQRREGLNSIFNVLEPIYRNSSTASGGIRNKLGITRPSGAFFRDYDEFYVVGETHAINLFRSSIALSTAKGIEVMSLDKKFPFSIPDLKAPDVKPIAEHIRDLSPLGMFRISDDEFLLVFNEVAIYVNKYGDISRRVIMEFLGSATQACLVDGLYLVLIDTNGGFVEVRNAMNGRLRQIVSGRYIRLVDDGVNSTGGNIMIRMRHPDHKGSQLVLEMVINPDMKE